MHIKILALSAILIPACVFAQSSAPPVPPSGTRCSLHTVPHTEADQALAAGDYPHAQELFTTQLAAQPTVANYSGLVDSQLAQDNYQAAIETAQHAVAVFSTSADALALSGDALLRAGRIPEAFAAYARAVALDPCSYRAHLGLGNADLLAARHASAMQQLSLAHKLAPADVSVTVAFLQAMPPAERTPLLRAFLAEKPTLPQDQFNSLTAQSTLLNDRDLCQPEIPVTNASFEIQPVLFTGRVTRSWGLRLSVNGTDLPLLEVDSSVSGIVLNPADAARANVHPVNASSTTAPYAAVANRIRIGSVEYLGCPVTVVPAAQLAGANSLIGTSFFRDNLIRIDYPAHTLTLSPLPQPAVTGPFGLTDPPPVAAASNNWNPAYVAGGKLLLPTLINNKGPFLFALDTGLNVSVYSPAVTHSQLVAVAENNSRLQGSSGTIVKVIPRDGGITDRTQIRNTDGALLDIYTPLKFPVLRYTGVEMPDPYVISFDLTPVSHQAGTEVSALLGFHMLSYFNIELNYRDGLVKLVYDQNRRYHVMQAQLQNQ